MIAKDNTLRQAELLAMLDSAIAFTVATKTLVADIRTRGYRHDDPKPIAGPGTRPVRDVWRASNAVAHFTLHQAFEAHMKTILALEGSRVPNIHPLAKLYDRLGRESKAKLNLFYGQTIKTVHVGNRFAVAFKTTSHPIPPARPPETEANTVRQWFALMDEQMRLSERRYEADDIRRSRWTIYYLDFEPMFEMLGGIQTYATTLFNRWARNARSHQDAGS